MTKVHQIADFTDKNLYVGIDVHKTSWSVALYCDQLYLRTFSQPPSVEGLNSFLKRNYPGATYLCGYESGFSGFWIQRQLKQAGIECFVIHPGDIPHTQKHKTAKTDSIDARGIAQALAHGSVRPIYVPDLETESDRSLIRQRERILKDIRRNKQRIRSMLLQFGVQIPTKFNKSWSNQFISWLKALNFDYHTAQKTLNSMIEQLELMRASFLKLNKEIRALQKNDKYNGIIQILMTVPGIGPLTAITLLAEISDIRRFPSRRHLNSFVGLYPMEFSSGQHEYKGSITFRNNRLLRTRMIEAGWTAVRHDPVMTLVYNEWSQRMGGKRAIIKIARKLLARVRHIWVHEEAYIRGLIK